MSMSPNQVASWGLWSASGMTGEQHACSLASYGLETSLPAGVFKTVIMLPDGRLVLQIGGSKGTLYLGLS